jgi:tripartite-type tricarboxylate transporter receptor subunit TctC
MKHKLNAVPRILAACFALACLTAGSPAWSQPYPAKPVRVYVPFPAGGGTDIVARILMQKMSENLGQQFLIDNRGGAGGVLGTSLAAKSPADGYTLFMGTMGNFSVNPSLYPKLPFDIARDFVPITVAVNVPYFLFAHPALPVSSVKELIALAKSRPGQILYASSGNGSAPHLAGALFESVAGVTMVHIPYKGGAQSWTDLIGGQVQLGFYGGLQGFPQAKVGKVKILAALAAKRSSLLPNVPTIGETLPGFDFTNWMAVAAPAGTPKEIVARLHSEIVKVMNTPEIREHMAQQGAEPIGNTPEQAAAFIKAETVKWARIVKQANVKSE